MKINKTSSSAAAQNSRLATEQIDPTRKRPVATCKHVGDRPTKMHTKADQDQDGQDDGERDLPCPWVWILPT